MTAGSMGADVANDPDTAEAQIHAAGVRAMRQKAAELREHLCAERGLEPSQACLSCGRPSATAAECEHFGVCVWLASDDTEGGEC
jgi:hypothetical protein